MCVCVCVAVGYVALPVVTVTAALSVTRRQTSRLARPDPQTSLGPAANESGQSAFAFVACILVCCLRLYVFTSNSHTFIIGCPSPTHSFTLGLNPSISANPPTAPFPFSHLGFTIWISQTVYCYF